MEQEHLRSCDLCQSNELETIDKSSNICRCQACGYIKEIHCYRKGCCNHFDRVQL